MKRSLTPMDDAIYQSRLVAPSKVLTDYVALADYEEAVREAAATDVADAEAATGVDDAAAAVAVTYDSDNDDGGELDAAAGEDPTRYEQGVVEVDDDEFQAAHVSGAPQQVACTLRNDAHGEAFGGVGRGRAGQTSDGGDAAQRTLKLGEIDAFWVQRLARQYPLDVQGAEVWSAEATAAAIVETLGNQAHGDAECEGEVAMLEWTAPPEALDLVMMNRWRIYWATVWKQATDDARSTIEAQMQGGGAAWMIPVLRGEVGEGEHEVGQQANGVDGVPNGDMDGTTDQLDGQGIGYASAAQTADGASSAPPGLVDLRATAAAADTYVADSVSQLPEGADEQIMTQRSHQFTLIHVPPARHEPERIPLVPIADLPEFARPAFDGYESLNLVQSAVYPKAMAQPDAETGQVKRLRNLLVCAPTGAGKTNVALLAMLDAMHPHVVRSSSGDFYVKKDQFKMVYIAPMKSLVAEMVGTFSKRLEPYGLTVRELTGDMFLTRSEIQEAQLIVTTPEKWDVVTRKAGDRTFTRIVSLVIIDEIHLLHDKRGPVLESVIARIMRQVEVTRKPIRIVGLSATLPNYVDVAHLLRVDKGNGVAFFGSEYRPVQLDQYYIGVAGGESGGGGGSSLAAVLRKRGFGAEANGGGGSVAMSHQLMNEVCYEKAMETVAKTADKQVLIFVHSRKDTVTTCRYLFETATARGMIGHVVRERSPSGAVLREAVEEHGVHNRDLADLLPHGYAFHHAGMSRKDRNLVEELMENRHIRILVSTATLAWGVNLPAYSVIIKGTQVYDSEVGGWTRLSQMDVQQMLGRAGRPQFDTKGVGTVITTRADLQHYVALLNAQIPVESQMLSQLCDALNAEIVLGTVRNVDDAVHWLRYTFLYIRMLMDPERYGISKQMQYEQIGEGKPAGVPPLLKYRHALIHSAATDLAEAGLISYDPRVGYLKATALGSIASDYYLGHNTMRIFRSDLREHTDDIGLFRVFSLADEFSSIQIRDEERAELRRLAADVPIPIVEKVTESPTAKINILLQVYISRFPLEGFTVGADMVYVSQNAGRLFRAMFQVARIQGWAQLARRTLLCSQMIEHRMWMVQSPLRQFRRVPVAKRNQSAGTKRAGSAVNAPCVVPTDVITRLEARDHVTWEHMMQMGPDEIDEIIGPLRGRSAAMSEKKSWGERAHNLVRRVPRMTVKVFVQTISHEAVQFEIVLSLWSKFVWDEKYHGTAIGYWVMVDDVDGIESLASQYTVVPKARMSYEHTVTLRVGMVPPFPPLVFVRVMADGWIGAETVKEVMLDSVHVLKPFAQPTLLRPGDRESGPDVCTLHRHHPRVFASLPVRQYGFNRLQKQAFALVYRTDDNVLIAAPPASGVDELALLALMRAHWQALYGEDDGDGDDVEADKLDVPDGEVDSGERCGMRAICIATTDSDAARTVAYLRATIGAALGLRIGRLICGARDGPVSKSDGAGWKMRGVYVNPSVEARDTIRNHVHIGVVSAADGEKMTRGWTTSDAESIDLIVVWHVECIGDGAVSGLGSGHGDERGAVSRRSRPNLDASLELAVSRLRSLASGRGADDPLRIVGLCAQRIGYPMDVARWLGVRKGAVLNFSESDVSAKSTIDVQSLKWRHTSGLRSAMCGVAFDRIVESCHLRSDSGMSGIKASLRMGDLSGAAAPPRALVVAPQRKHVVAVGHELSMLCGGRNAPRLFLGASNPAQLDELAAHVASLLSPIVARGAWGRLLCSGIAVVHSGMSLKERGIALQLFREGVIRLMLLELTLLWAVQPTASTIVLFAMNNDALFDADVLRAISLRDQRAAYSRPLDSAQRLSEAERQAIGTRLRVTICCREHDVDRYRQLAVDGTGVLLLESSVDSSNVLLSWLNAAVASKAFSNKTDAVQFMSWTFLFHRLCRNPLFYGVAHDEKSDKEAFQEAVCTYLTDKVDRAAGVLAESGCIVEGQEEDMALRMLPLGMIASHYCLSPETIEIFAASTTKATDMRGVLEIVSAAIEFEDILCVDSEGISRTNVDDGDGGVGAGTINGVPFRGGPGGAEAGALEQLARHCPIAVAAQQGSKLGNDMDGEEDASSAEPSYSDVSSRVFVLLQAHMKRLPLHTPAQFVDLQRILRTIMPLLYAFVDVSFLRQWLRPASAAMDLAQLISQGMWLSDSYFMQLPFVSASDEKAIATRALLAKHITLAKKSSKGGEDDDDDEEVDEDDLDPSDVCDAPDSFQGAVLPILAAQARRDVIMTERQRMREGLTPLRDMGEKARDVALESMVKMMWVSLLDVAKRFPYLRVGFAITAGDQKPTVDMVRGDGESDEDDDDEDDDERGRVVDGTVAAGDMVTVLVRVRVGTNTDVNRSGVKLYGAPSHLGADQVCAIETDAWGVVPFSTVSGAPPSIPPLGQLPYTSLDGSVCAGQLTSVPPGSGIVHDRHMESWWAFVADDHSALLLAVKRLTFVGSSLARLTFRVPAGTTAGDLRLRLCVVCDSYRGADSIETFTLSVSE